MSMWVCRWARESVRMWACELVRLWVCLWSRESVCLWSYESVCCEFGSLCLWSCGSVCGPVNLSVNLWVRVSSSVSLSLFVWVCESVCMWVCESVCMWICLSEPVSPFVCDPSVFFYLWSCLSFCLSVSLPFSARLSLFACLSLFVCLFGLLGTCNLIERVEGIELNWSAGWWMDVQPVLRAGNRFAELNGLRS